MLVPISCPARFACCALLRTNSPGSSIAAIWSWFDGFLLPGTKPPAPPAKPPLCSFAIPPFCSVSGGIVEILGAPGIFEATAFAFFISQFILSITQFIPFAIVAFIEPHTVETTHFIPCIAPLQALLILLVPPKNIFSIALITPPT